MTVPDLLGADFGGDAGLGGEGCFFALFALFLSTLAGEGTTYLAGVAAFNKGFVGLAATLGTETSFLSLHLLTEMSAFFA